MLAAGAAAEPRAAGSGLAAPDAAGTKFSLKIDQILADFAIFWARI